MISHAVRQQLQEKLERARRLVAVQKPDRKQVHALLAECLVADPGNTIYIDALLQNLAVWRERRGIGAWLGRLFRSSEFDRAAKAHDWPRVLQLVPSELASDPRDIGVLQAAASACAALDLPHAELRYRQALVEAQSGSLDSLRQLARALARLGQYDDSRRIWQQVQSRMPRDAEAAHLLAELSGEGATSDSTATAPSNADPENIDAVLQAAATLCQAADFDAAEELLADALARAGGELRLRERLEELTVERSRHKLAIARQRAAAEPTDAARSLVRQMRDEVNRLELGLFHSRAERYPARADVKLELAIRLKRASNFSGAIEQLRAIERDAEFASAAYVELGECTQHLRQFEQALGYYRQAIEQADSPSDRDSFCMALYRAGVLAEAMQRAAEAREHFERLVAIDGNFKDARQRLDKVIQICDKT